MTTWAIAATIKAPTDEILRFAAHHLEAGASALFIYLDRDDPVAREALGQRPDCDVTVCDAHYWETEHGRRPVKHQVRQSRNANHAYARAGACDWLIHMDVDEFLIADRPVREMLSALPLKTVSARVRPDEALCPPGGGAPVAFKAFIPNGPERHRLVEALYPTFGAYLKGGFVSHLAGKVFVRTGLKDTVLRIHNVMQNGAVAAPEAALTELRLAHLHTRGWEHWRETFAYRHAHGSYRADLSPARPREEGGMTLHELFDFLLSDQGEDGLRMFFDEVCADRPEVRARLAARGLLRFHKLDTERAKSLYFPGFTD